MATAAQSDVVAIALKVVGVARTVSEVGESPVSSLTRFKPGTQLVVEEGSELVLVFASGQRYRVGPGSRVSFEASSLLTFAGSAEILPPVAALVELWPLVTRPGTLEPAAAARIRSLDELSPTLGLRPASGALVDANRLSLRFSSVSGARQYSVRIEEASSGRLLWSTELTHNRLTVPLGALPPGATLYWEVEARDGKRSLARESAFVHTVPDLSRQRRELAAQVAVEPELAPLLAALDAQLAPPPQPQR